MVMAAEEKQIRFSLGARLLSVSVTVLLVLIALLTLSTVLILREDKRVYLFESQASQSLLAGREVASLARHSIQTLRILLGRVDLARAGSLSESELQASLKNQTDLSFASLSWVDAVTGVPIRRLVEAGASDATRPTAEQIAARIPELLTDGYSFLSVSRPGSPAALGILVSGGMPAGQTTGQLIAYGIVPLQDFAASLGAADLTVISSQGRPLFSTDPLALYSTDTLVEDPLFQAAKASLYASGSQEFELGGRTYLGSYFKPGLKIFTLARTDWNRAARAIYSLTERLVLIGLMVVSLAVMIAIFFARSLVAPINRLVQATREISAGNFNVNLSESRGDEIGALSRSFNSMSARIVGLLSENSQKVQLENEVAIAATVQANFFPPEKFTSSHIELASFYKSAASCGGDWWGFFETPKRFYVMIADATGHGLPSALLTASIRSCFSVLHELISRNPDLEISPNLMLQFAHRAIRDASQGGLMMTLFLGSLEFETNEFRYANAGHNPPWLFHKIPDGFSLKSLAAKGVRIGDRGGFEYEERTVQLSEGDLLFLYTDGLVEQEGGAKDNDKAKDKDKDESKDTQYGKKHARAVIQSHLKSSPARMIQHLTADFMKHLGSQALTDDVTIVAARILRGPTGSAPATSSAPSFSPEPEGSLG